MNPWDIATPEWVAGNLPARSASLYSQVVEQFFQPPYLAALQPSFNERLDRWDTYCNILVSWASKANGCEIPHFVPAGLDAGLGLWRFRELSANATIDWLVLNGTRAGWGRELDLDRIREKANAGFPCVVAWKNPNPAKSGHIAMVMPSPADGPFLISQAGREVFHQKPLPQGFGLIPLADLRFFSHS